MKTRCDTIDSTTGTAVRISNKYPVVVGLMLDKGRLKSLSDLFRTVMQRGVQTLDVERRPRIGLLKRR